MPDGRILVTERPGRMRIAGKDGVLSPPLAGLPPVWAVGWLYLVANAPCGCIIRLER